MLNDPTPLTRKQVIRYAAMTVLVVVAVLAFLLMQIVMWNRAANGQAALQELMRLEQAGQATAPVPSAAPTPAKPVPPEKGK